MLKICKDVAVYEVLKPIDFGANRRKDSTIKMKNILPKVTICNFQKFYQIKWKRFLQIHETKFAWRLSSS